MQCNIAGRFMRTVQALMDAQRAPQEYGTGEKLYQGEVQFLELVHTHPQLNTSALAAHMGVTCGAVTQAAARLIEKGLLEQYILPPNRKEKRYRLTDTGEQARRGYEAQHQSANEQLCRYICELPPGEAESILRFLDTLRELMPISMFDCRQDAGCPCHLEETTTQEEHVCWS